ncbi:aspartate/glutamate racemase family protein [Streptomyces sp. NBC_00690]|uniref:aspartate/glutamate racemase family protein n=1 Tax=Streptomyces sp. NBC_00690 TaxID=2975808 RepID=UPI002E298041|nr:aspartate/glutamate racemase family protein [Streptomyces sp. NBC_00690]
MIALLHTSPVHVPVFDALRDRDHPGVQLLHIVRVDLLDRAVKEGPDAAAPALVEALTEAVGQGATSVLCTCSTLGAVAEASAAAVGVPVVRVDRPMAAAAARMPRVTVVAALASTVEPTVALIQEEARALSEGRGGRDPDVRAVVVEGAWERFLDGDREGYLDSVAAAVDALGDADADGDVVVLAQASMADAGGRVRMAVPVLSSPRSGLRGAVEAARAHRGSST